MMAVPTPRRMIAAEETYADVISTIEIMVGRGVRSVVVMLEVTGICLSKIFIGIVKICFCED